MQVTNLLSCFQFGRLVGDALFGRGEPDRKAERTQIGALRAQIERRRGAQLHRSGTRRVTNREQEAKRGATAPPRGEGAIVDGVHRLWRLFLGNSSPSSVGASRPRGDPSPPEGGQENDMARSALLIAPPPFAHD